MGETLTVLADWAVATRRGDGGYKVEECGPQGLSAEQYARVLERFDPGPLAEDEPRVTVSWVGRESEARLGMLIERDGKARYVCLPWRALQDNPVSYLALYLALCDVDLGEPVSVPVEEAKGRAAELVEYGVQNVGAVAALLLDGRDVAVTGAEGTGAVQRLHYLDAVTSLLPYGYRFRLTASTGVDHAAPRRIAFGFGRLAPAGGVGLDWNGTRVPAPRTPPAREYAALLAARIPDRPALVRLTAKMTASARPLHLTDPAPALAALRTPEHPAQPRWRLPHEDRDPPPSPTGLPIHEYPPFPPPSDDPTPPAAPPQARPDPPAAPPRSEPYPPGPSGWAEPVANGVAGRPSGMSGPAEPFANSPSSWAEDVAGAAGRAWPDPSGVSGPAEPYPTGASGRGEAVSNGDTGRPSGMSGAAGVAGRLVGGASVDAVLRGLRRADAEAAAEAVRALPEELRALGVRPDVAERRAVALARGLAERDEGRAAMVAAAASGLAFHLELLAAAQEGGGRLGVEELEVLEDAERLLHDLLERARSRRGRVGRLPRVGRGWARQDEQG
ncbi:hypothetical protein [Actinocorallia sp. A-T 12471]|uniref:hypothetical protein n=1 Tax=Actinocorallia sp. A-T 12471 TaxID=3089813 RepID=UPI0029D3A980|nr:hypothetical protein [Actinocorallia sp. A-T 12471]MDX6742800.1 hypothetical protein [Actinocorallia sp. A-T 12471]